MKSLLHGVVCNKWVDWAQEAAQNYIRRRPGVIVERLRVVQHLTLIKAVMVKVVAVKAVAVKAVAVKAVAIDASYAEHQDVF